MSPASQLNSVNPAGKLKTDEWAFGIDYRRLAVRGFTDRRDPAGSDIDPA
jgi:hypothetical protein